jgi:hypothetical protein
MKSRTGRRSFGNPERRRIEMAKVDMTHVPDKGSGPAELDLIGVLE